MQKHYKSNVVYELLIHGVYHYIGCHCVSKDYLLASEIINKSGNYLAEARNNSFITPQEYRECVELVNVWEFDTKEEAQNFETLKIQELKEKYGDLCKNKASYGNQNGPKGVSRSEEFKRKLSEAHRGKQLSEEHKRKIGEAKKGHSVSEETKRKISEAHKGKGELRSLEGRLRNIEANRLYHWYTNGEINIKAKECLPGFYPGRILERKKVN